MATYTKKLKTLNVHLMLDSEVVTIADTADNDMATRALNEFKKYGSMHYETEEGEQNPETITNEIPYHAVQYIEVTEADASVEKPDPYGCEGGSDAYVISFDVSAVSGASPIAPITWHEGDGPILLTDINCGKSPYWKDDIDERYLPNTYFSPTKSVTLVAVCN